MKRCCHVAVDALPWNGHTTTCHALWMGVPVVSVQGRAPAGRLALSVLARCNRLDWVCDTVAEVPERVRSLVSGEVELARFKRDARDELSQSLLMDSDAFGSEFVSLMQSELAKR